MQSETLGKMLPRILFPYVQQWAERSGMTLLSRLLVDEQFRGLLEKYGDEVMSRVMQPGYPPGNGNAPHQGSDPAAPPTYASPGASPGAPDSPMNGSSSLAKLQERVLAMEAQETVLSILRNRMRPLALALGCCPECLVGVDGCPKCWGQSRVAYYPPDVSLLEAQVVNPLAARGVPLRLGEPDRPSANGADRTRARKSNGVRRRTRHA
ncbi:MAG TPA: hypothetical protein VI232_16965 [Reyranella sp.]